MKDIKRPSQNLRFNNESSKTAPSINLSNSRRVSVHASRTDNSYNHIDRVHVKDLKHKVEDFEHADYQDDYNHNEEGEDYNKNDNFYDKYRGVDSANKNRKLKQGGRLMSKSKRNASIIFALLAVLFVLYTFVFNSATITIIPKILDKKIKDTYSFVNSNSASSVNSFELVMIEKSLEKDVPKSDKQKVIAKASGMITIYNNFSADNQKLIKNTRFESASGQIFRISDTVLVPGKVGSTQGKIQVKVTADTVGEAHNVAAGKFTIPGFKGTPRFSGFYGESSSAMSGGSNTEKSVIAKSDIDSAINDMTIELKDKIKVELANTKKEGFTVLKDDVSFVISNNLANFESGKDSKFKLFAKGQLVLVNNKELAKILIKKEDSNYKGEDIYIKNISDLKVKKQNDVFVDAASSTPLMLSVEGLPTFVYKTNVQELKKDMASKDDNDSTVSGVLSKYTSIKSAKSKITPFWTSSYPSNVNKIKVIEQE